MTKTLLRGELQKLRNHRTFWIMAAVLAGLSVLYVFMQTNTYFIDDMLEMSVDKLKKGPDIFWRIIADPSVLGWFSVPFAGLLLGTDFGERGISQILMAGYSRKKLFLVKTIEYYVLFLPVLAIYPVGAILRCCLPWIRTMDAADAAYFWQGVSLKFVLDMNFISVGFFLVFLCRDVLKSIAASLGAALLMNALPRISVGDTIRSLNPIHYYSYIVPKRDILPGSYWDIPPINTAEILLIVIGSLLVIGLCIWGAYRLFQRAELK